jgi:hypothetical protein
MIRDLLGVLSAAASVVAGGAALIFAVTVGALFLPRGFGLRALLTAGLPGIGALAFLGRVLGGKAPSRGAVEVAAVPSRPLGRCPVCRTGGVRRGRVGCAERLIRRRRFDRPASMTVLLP